METTPVTWSIATASAEGPDDQVSFRIELEPGGEHRDHLAVTNYSEQEVSFALTASDGVVSEAGNFGLLSGDADPTGAGAWIDVPEDVTVPARQTAVVPFTITVPEDALPGDHPGGVAATLAGGSEGIGLDAGVGVRVHLRVGGEIVPRIDLTEASGSYATSWNPLQPGTLDLAWTVHNSGNVRLGAHQVLEVLAPLGLDPGVAQQVVAQQREVLPGQSASFTASVEAWPFGRLTAQLTSTQEVVGADLVAVDLPTATTQVGVTAVPWPHLLALGILLLAIGRAVVRRRRSRERVARAVAEARAEGARGADAESSPSAVSHVTSR